MYALQHTKDGFFFNNPIKNMLKNVKIDKSPHNFGMVKTKVVNLRFY